jgi:hypothetical protein
MNFIYEGLVGLEAISSPIIVLTFGFQQVLGL